VLYDLTKKFNRSNFYLRIAAETKQRIEPFLKRLITGDENG